MNAIDKAIERELEKIIEGLERNLHVAREYLEELRRHHRRHHKHLAFVLIGFDSIEKGAHMAPATAPGPVTLTSAGQQTTARLFYYDQDGNPMPSDFTPPAAAFSTDDTAGKVAKIVDNGDGTATVTDVADGTATLSVSIAIASPDGAITASETITVSNTAPPPPPRVLTSVKIGFDS